MRTPPLRLRTRAERRSPQPSPELRPIGRERRVSSDDGTALYVEEFGAQQPTGTIVLAHGYWQSSRLWAGQVRDLIAARPDLDVVVYDHRGHGRSDRCARETSHIEQLGRDLAVVLDAVAPTGPVVLAGHSMGGMTMMALAEQRPELFGDRIVGAAFVGTSCGGLADVTYGLPRPVVKAVLRTRIDVNVDLGPLGLDGLDIGQRNARVLFAEMQLRRYLRLVVGEANDGATVIADRG